jgi:hypothetical protein
MSTRTVSLTPQEALARDLIGERVAARHHAPKAQGSRRRHARRHTRAALLLRRLAERLDPSVVRDAGDAHDVHDAGRVAGAVADATPGRLSGAPHAGSPRPWSAAPRRTPHRQS